MNSSIIQSTGVETLVVWFRNELRVQDHLALWSASRDARKVIPVYIVDEEFLASPPHKQIMVLNTLQVIRDDMQSLGGKLFIRFGEPHKCLMDLLDGSGAAGIYLTSQYEPVVRRSDAKLASALGGMGKIFKVFKDQVLFEGAEILNRAAEPYKVYSAYRRAWLERSVDVAPPLPPLRRLSVPVLEQGEIPLGRELGLSLRTIRTVDGSEKAGLKTLKGFIDTRLDAYGKRRDLLYADGTSRISHHLSIGSLGVRSVYDMLKRSMDSSLNQRERNDDTPQLHGAETFLNQIIWREFYKQILVNFPHVDGNSFRKSFDSIPWKTNVGHFNAWRDGVTGYPIIDAAMRQLKSEGWMHNRARMIVSSFLTKDLHIHWSLGERHFMEWLADGDLALNNGGWQWSAGTGTDAQPWYRIFNPVLQGRKFDPRGEFVRKYLPELHSIPDRYIHAPWEMPESVAREAGIRIGGTYPAPIINHEAERKIALAIKWPQNAGGRSQASLRYKPSTKSTVNSRTGTF